MNPVPELDPNWVRRQQHSLPDHSNTLALVITALLIGVAAYLWKSSADRETALANAKAASAAMAAGAQARTLRDQEARRISGRIEELQRSRNAIDQEGIGSSIGGRAIHRWGYAGTSGLQLGPCKAPWVELPAEGTGSRAQRVWEQERMQAAADAKLRVEQARLASLAGSDTWAPGYSQPVPSAQARCADAKAQRDEAYRIVGNNRTFEFIRRWDDIVFEACKNS